MAILALNHGSSSDKISLFSQDGKRLHDFERLEDVPKEQIQAIGYRFVHGGNAYRSTVKLNPKILRDLEKLTELAPLHNAPSLKGIKNCLERFGWDIPHFVVFDTAFFKSMPKVATTYAILQKYGIKRFGFHGIAHAFLSKMHQNEGSIITLHLGNGCSMAAIKEGKPLDTSMGYTPLEGLVMATRSGDLDPAAVEFLCSEEKKGPKAIIELLNRESGLLALTGLSSMEKLVQLYTTDEKAKLAVDLFCYRAVKYMGAYLTVLSGSEAFLFSGGIGENSPFVRQKIMEGMKWYGVKLDSKINEETTSLKRGEMKKISDPLSKVQAYVVGMDENSMIAEEVLRLI